LFILAGAFVGKNDLKSNTNNSIKEEVKIEKPHQIKTMSIMATEIR